MSTTVTFEADSGTPQRYINRDQISVDIANDGGQVGGAGATTAGQRITGYVTINKSGGTTTSSIEGSVTDAAVIKKAVADATKVNVIKQNPKHADVKTDTDGDGDADKIAEMSVLTSATKAS